MALPSPRAVFNFVYCILELQQETARLAPLFPIHEIGKNLALKPALNRGFTGHVDRVDGSQFSYTVFNYLASAGAPEFARTPCSRLHLVPDRSAQCPT